MIVGGHRYRLKYKLETERGSFSPDEIIRTGTTFAADALVVISCVYSADGAYGQNFVCIDGRGPEMPASDVWKAWVMLAAALATDEGLSPNKRDLCARLVEIVQGSRPATPDPEPGTVPPA